MAAFALALAVLLCAGLGFLLGTQAGLNFGLTQVPNLQVEKVQGSVWAGFSAERLLWQGQNANGKPMLVDVAGLEFKPDWSNFHNRLVLIKSIRAHSVSLDIPPSEDDIPVVLPEKIDLPVDVQVQSLNIQTLHFNQMLVSGIEGAATAAKGVFTLHRLNLNVEGAAVQANAAITLNKPYPIDGGVQAQRQFDGLTMLADLSVGGSLEKLMLNLNATGRDSGRPGKSQALKVQAGVMPFSAVPLERVDLQASQFNPQDWFASAPRARLNAQAKVYPNADFTQTTGTIDVQNTAPLSLQSGGIPVSNLSLNFQFDLENQKPQRIQLRVPTLQFASGPQAAGSSQLELDWVASSAQRNTSQDRSLANELMQGNAQFNLVLQQLRPFVFAVLPPDISVDGTLQGNKQGDSIELTEFNLKDRQAQLQGTLSASLVQQWPLDVQLSVSKVNPALYVKQASPLMQGQINGTASYKGQLSGPLDGSPKSHFAPNGVLQVDLNNSTLAKAPLVFNAQLQGGPQVFESVLLNFDVLGNTVNASGRYGQPGDAVVLKANLARLPELGKLVQRKLAGSAVLNAKLTGQGAQTSAQGDLNIDGLVLDNLLAVKSASGQFNLGAMPNSTWQADLNVVGVGQPGSNALDWVKTLVLQLRGTRSQHTLQVQADTGFTPISRQRPVKASLQLAGGVQNLNRPGKPLGWKGVLQALKVEGMWSPARSLVLQEPVSLAFAPRFVELSGLSLKGEDSTLINNRILRIAGADVQIEGDVPALGVPRLSPILRTQVSVEPKDLVAKIKWRYRANAREVDGRVEVSHVSGGLQVLEDSQIDVPIQAFQASLDFNRSKAALDLVLNAADFGRVTANLSLPVQQNKATKAWGLAGDLPMQGAVGASFERLNWLGPMISGGVRTTGTAQVAMAIAGTVNKPDVQGRLFAMDLDVFQLDQGVRLEDGNVVVDFTADQAKIDTFDFTVYNRQAPRRRIEELGPLIQGNGKLTASGQWNLAGLNGGLSVQLDRAPIIQRPDRWALVSSNIQVQQPTVEGQPLKVRGDVNVHGAYIETPESGAAKLGDDVVVKGRTQTSTAGMPLDAQIQANLGKLFYLNAQGLRTRLEGGLRLVMLEGVGGSGQRKAGRRLSATGTIQTVDGTYRAYGQDLTIDRGVVNFQGPLENPGINVRAVRKGVAVEAGVEVSGTAQRPKVTLVSDPAVPDSEKLSWMIIGRGTNSADRDQTLLLTAAAAIFGDDEDSPTRKIAKQLGIDDFSLSTGSLTAVDSRAVGSKVAIAPGADVSASSIGDEDPLLSQRIISIGKRISDQVYASFDQSVTTAASILKLNYQYSRQLSFIARTGADNAIDALYQISFD